MPTIRTAESWIHYYKRLVEVSDKAATAPCLPPPPSLSGSHSRLIWLVPTMEAPSTLKPAEVALAMAAQKALAEQGVAVRVVSMPSTNVFDRQDAAYKASVRKKKSFHRSSWNPTGSGPVGRGYSFAQSFGPAAVAPDGPGPLTADSSPLSTHSSSPLTPLSPTGATNHHRPSPLGAAAACSQET